MSEPGHRCAICGEEHRGLTMAWGADAPASWQALSPDERRFGTLTADWCRIGRAGLFVRGCLVLRIRGGGAGDVFTWLVWVRVSAADFRRATSLWRRLARWGHLPLPGTLDDDLPYTPPTRGLPVRAHYGGAGMRPLVVVEPSSHPLAVEQHGQISHERAVELASGMAHAAAARRSA